MFEKLLVAIGLRTDVGAPVHAGVNPVYFTNVYSANGSWTFSWRSADHTQGGIQEGFITREDANVICREWTKDREQLHCASILHESEN